MVFLPSIVPLYLQPHSHQVSSEQSVSQFVCLQLCCNPHLKLSGNYNKHHTLCHRRVDDKLLYDRLCIINEVIELLCFHDDD